jgi:hypothetical protein
MISRASRIPIRSAGIDPPLGLPKGRPDQANGGARQCGRDSGRDHSVMGGEIISKSGAGIIVEQVTQGGQASFAVGADRILLNCSS